MFDTLYARVKALAESRHAEASLAAIAFAESSFFPIPPDVLLAPMALAQPQRAWRFALIATVASVVGGMLGYAIGALLYDTIGHGSSTLRLRREDGRAEGDLRAAGAGWSSSSKGATPIPYKLITITSGLLGYSFPLFVGLSDADARSAVLSGRRSAEAIWRSATARDGAEFRGGSRRRSPRWSSPVSSSR